LFPFVVAGAKKYSFIIYNIRDLNIDVGRWGGPRHGLKVSQDMIFGGGLG